MSKQVASAPISRRAALKAGAAGMALALTFGDIGPAVVKELARLADGKPMTGARLANILQTERSRWNALLAEIGADRMEIPGVEGEWSVKQIVAHLTWYERAIVDGAQRVANGEPFRRRRPEGVGLDDWNAQLATESRQRPLADVLAEADQVFAQLVTIIAACPDDILNDAQRLGLPDDIPPWMRVANNSYTHYREHEQTIRAWLTRQ